MVFAADVVLVVDGAQDRIARLLVCFHRRPPATAGRATAGRIRCAADELRQMNLRIVERLPVAQLPREKVHMYVAYFSLGYTVKVTGSRVRSEDVGKTEWLFQEKQGFLALGLNERSLPGHQSSDRMSGAVGRSFISLSSYGLVFPPGTLTSQACACASER